MAKLYHVHSPDRYWVREAQLLTPNCWPSDLVPFVDPCSRPFLERVSDTNNWTVSYITECAFCRYHGGFAAELREEAYLRWVSSVRMIKHTHEPVSDSGGCAGGCRNRALHSAYIRQLPSPEEPCIRALLAEPHGHGLYVLGRMLVALGQIQLLGLREYLRTHIPTLYPWLMTSCSQPGFVIWGFDRLVRVLRLVVLNKMWMFPSRRVSAGLTDTKVEVLGSDVLRVTVQRDQLSWKAGQHA